MTDSAVLDFYLHQAVLLPASPGAPFVAVPAVWNSADKTGTISLSNGNQTATSTGANAGVRATIFKSTGKWYFERTPSSLPTFSFFGLSTSGASLTAGGGAGQYGIFADSGGALSIANGTNVNSNEAFSAGGLWAFAVDFDAGKIWMYTNDGATWFPNGANVSGSPNAGTNPSLTFTANTPLTPYDFLSSGGIDTLNCGQTTFTGGGGVPTGYLAWKV